ncbi:hypothetical protein D9M70_530120 [compost metagenome]
MRAAGVPRHRLPGNNPRAATQKDELFSASAFSLEDHPTRGEPGKFLDTRESMAHESYRLIHGMAISALVLQVAALPVGAGLPANGLASLAS